MDEKIINEYANYLSSAGLLKELISFRNLSKIINDSENLTNMNDEEFIKKYKDKELTLKIYEDKDIFTYLIFVDGLPIPSSEEDAFWSLLPQTKIIYEDKNTEILKLII